MYPNPLMDEFTDDNSIVKNFVSTLQERGFIVQEGELKYIDILKLVSEGVDVDKETLVGPALFEVIWDRAILFTKKDNRENATFKDIIIKIGSMETRV